MMIHSMKEGGWLCEIISCQVSDELWKIKVSALNSLVESRVSV